MLVSSRNHIGHIWRRRAEYSSWRLTHESLERPALQSIVGACYPETPNFVSTAATSSPEVVRAQPAAELLATHLLAKASS